MNNRTKSKTTDGLPRLRKDKIDGEHHDPSELIMSSLLLRQLPLLQAIPEPAWLKDRKLRFVAINEAYVSAYSRTSGDLIGKTEYAIRQGEVAARSIKEDRGDSQIGVCKTHRGRIARCARETDRVETTRMPVRDDTGLILSPPGSSGT